MKLFPSCLFSIFLLIVIGTPSLISAKDPLREKYPNLILTPHYEILSEMDVRKDSRRFHNVPYGSKVIGNFWQCFPTSDVLFHFDTRKGNDAMGRQAEIVTLCDLDIKVRGKTTWSDYWGRRAFPVEICKDIETAWKELSQGELYVCFNGMPGGAETQIINGKIHRIKGWIWNRFRTKKGCYSYFENECSPIPLEEDFPY